MTYRYQITLVFLLGFFIDCINIFMLAIALPSIASEFHTDTSTVAWVANAYILGMTLIIPISPWLASRFGPRNIISLSMALFTISVLLCGFSSSFYELVSWRFIQGLGAGLMIPIGQSLTFSQFKNSQRAKVSTLVMAVALIAPAISPMIGGIIVEHFSWRWVFFSNAPLSILVCLLAWNWIRNERRAAVSKPDIWGLLLVSVALTALLMGMSVYANDQNSLVGVFTLPTVAALTLLYIKHDKNHEDAIINLSLLKNNKLTLSVIIYYAIPGVFTGVNLLNIFFLQDILNFSADKTGMFMILYGFGALIAMMFCGRSYNRIGPNKLFISSLILHSAGISTLLWVHPGSPLMVIMLAYTLMGIGGGLGANCAQTTALMDFDKHQMSKGSVIWNINRQVSFCVGAAFFTMVFNLLCVALQLPKIEAYHLTYLIAALIGILPLLYIKNLN
ncbi:multidrug efflux MFS transporter [Shewanella psychropiezotolerans]|uniref:Multidrug efflux MFS transporter n=1 Tax=Shewanella psychropiezotolerans TaxID=2593655 RepID=A0ABX5WSD1_9GAMM|nr:DHA2 family efflux MFS transporter permease subunit [Shewanella psychropiezotolerans]QDO82028.1 multidrug efflux MFS transporter [Shewanella psychropiezotolerans]